MSKLPSSFSRLRNQNLLFSACSRERSRGCDDKPSICRAFNQLDSVVNPEHGKRLFGGRNHLRAELKGDDLRLGVFSALIPSESAVTGVAANFQDCGRVAARQQVCSYVNRVVS